MLEFDQLKKMVLEGEDNVAKAEGGNKAAGTRVRKSMQDIKNAAQEVRKKVLEMRTETETEAEGQPTPPSPAAPPANPTA